MFYELAEKALALERSGRKIVRLNIGDTNLPAPQCAVDAAVSALHSQSSGYGPSAGLPELREAIAEREKCGMKNVVAGPGSKHLIFALLSVLANKKRTVAFPAPYWPAYSLAAAQLGLKEAAVGTTLEKKWQFDSLPSADVAIICNPLNPASTIYGDASVQKAIESAKENGTHVILDEAYRGIAFRKMPVFEGAVRVRSFSKEFNMENWRLGYLVAPEGIAAKVAKYNQITTTCLPPFVQKAGIACLEDEKELLAENTKIWKGRMAAVSKALKKAGFKFAQPQAGMYVFATHEGISDFGEYAMKLLDKGVAVAPGSDFGGYNKFVRICANQPEDVLEKAVEKMGEAAG